MDGEMPLRERRKLQTRNAIQAAALELFEQHGYDATTIDDIVQRAKPLSHQQGFLLTGADLRDHHRWPLERRPSLLETSMPGVFASGDVRHGSVKRVASAVGEGSIAIQLIQSLFAADQPEASRPAKEAAPALSDGR